MPSQKCKVIIVLSHGNIYTSLSLHTPPPPPLEVFIDGYLKWNSCFNRFDKNVDNKSFNIWSMQILAWNNAQKLKMKVLKMVDLKSVD